MSAPNLATIAAASLAWAQAHPNLPGIDTAIVQPEDSSSQIAIHTDIWNQVFDSLDDLNNQVLGTTAYANGLLTLTPGTIADDKVTIDGVYYQFAASPVSDGAADGTAAHPWQVKVGASNAGSLANLYAAINASGVGGTNYSTALTAHPTVTAIELTTLTVKVQSKANGTGGNALTTTVIVVTTADGLAWSGATLAGGAGTSAAAQAIVDSWRDSLRARPLLLNDAAQAELDAAVPALKTSIGALFT